MARGQQAGVAGVRLRAAGGAVAIASVILAGLGVFVLKVQRVKQAAADVSVECIFEEESPRARSGGRRRGKNVAKEAGLGVASRHRDLARHVVRHVVIAGQEDLLHAERVLVNLVVCCAH